MLLDHQAKRPRGTWTRRGSRDAATFERGYLDQKGDWQSSRYYGRDDLLNLAKVTDMANTRIHENQAEDRAHADCSAATTAAASEHVATRWVRIQLCAARQ